MPRPTLLMGHLSLKPVVGSRKSTLPNKQVCHDSTPEIVEEQFANGFDCPAERIVVLLRIKAENVAAIEESFSAPMPWFPAVFTARERHALLPSKRS